MRKHFLILMLLTLLPLSMWAADVEVRVYGSEQHFAYGNVTVPVRNAVSTNMVTFIPSTLSPTAKAAVVGKLQFAYTGAALTEESVPGTYEFTMSLISAGDRTISGLGDDNVYTIVIGDAEGSFVVDKATAANPTGAPTLVSTDLTYTGESQKLAGGATAPDGFVVEYSITGNEDGDDWTENGAFATAANETGYPIYYRTKGQGYYNPSAKQYLGDSNKKAIAKAAITLTGGTAATGLTFDGTARQLLTAAVTVSEEFTPTLVYTVDKFGATDYNDTYNVIEPANAIADVKVTNQGKYRVKCDISDADKANLTVTPKVIADIVVAKGSPIKTAPAALKPSYTNAEQPLISTGTAVEGATILYCATNSDTPSDWTTTVPKGTYATGHDLGGGASQAYTAWYKVAADDINGNWDAVEPTEIDGVTIEKAIVTVKVNNMTKVYDGTTSLAAAIVDGGNPKFTFITLKTGDDAAAYNGVSYSAVTAVNASDNAYANVLTVATADLTAINDNYAYYIQRGNLKINKAKLTVTATTTNANYGEASAATILEAYTIKDQNNADVTAASAFAEGHFPKLTSAQAAAAAYKPGSYDVAFTTGTLNIGGNYEMSTAGENEDGYVIGDAKYIIGKAPQVIITVIPKSVQYGTEEDWDAEPVEDEDYYVANLLPNDQISNISLTREGYADEQFGVKTYALTATATIAHPEWYENDGAIIFNNSTFTITPRKLTATIAQQTIVKDVTTTFDATLWDVTPMQFGQDKDVLNATLALAGGAAASLGENPQGIVLTIDNPNYVLDGDNVEGGKAYGKLIVIEANSFAIQSSDANLLEKLQTAEANNTNYVITFTGDDRVMLEKEWYAMVLPFNTTPLELAKNLNTYVVVNVLKSSKIEYNSKTARDEAVVSFGLEMDNIPAGTPFLIKPAGETEWNTTNNTTNSYSARKIISVVNPTVTAKATFDATYETGLSLQWGYETDGVTPNENKKYRFLGHSDDGLLPGSTTDSFENAWYNCKSAASKHTLIPMEAFLILDKDAQGARIFVEDFENGTTAIKSLTADQVNGLKVIEGWYTINGVKLQGMPTEKGIYINNGKKVVIK